MAAERYDKYKMQCGQQREFCLISFSYPYARGGGGKKGGKGRRGQKVN